MPFDVTSCLISLIIIIYKQQFLYSNWLKTCQLMQNQWNFTSATLNRIRFVFYHNNQDNERNLCQDLLTIENTNSDLKVHALHYANELLVRVRLSFQNLLQTHSTWRNNTKKMFKSTDHDKPLLHSYVFMFFTTISTPKKMRVFFFRARAEKGIARHIDASSVVRTLVIFDWFVLSMRMQVILDSPFARPGSAPIGGGKKGEFRDWTSFSATFRFHSECTFV